MKRTKQELLDIYAKAGKVAQEKRELLFYRLKDINEIPENVEYSDEAYADYIGLDIAQAISTESANEYLKNVFNKLSLISFITIAGNRVELFNRGLCPYVPYGDTAELIYTDLREPSGYDKTKFIPDELVGGDVVDSQRIKISSIVGTTNTDKKVLDVVVPTLIISQALNSAIQTGLANGWPTIFDEQMRRSWDKWKFERFRELVARAGGTPSLAEWFNPNTTWTANDNQFIAIPTKVTDADSFQQLLVQIYGVSAELEGQYHNEYNPAGITQINDLTQQGLFLDSSLEAYWRSTNSIIYNSEIIDVKNVYRTVDFVKLLPSKVKADVTNIKAIIYCEYPFMHYPFTDGTYRGIQLFERNRTTAIYDHLWVASGIDLSKNIIIFYEPQEQVTLSKNTSTVDAPAK